MPPGTVNNYSFEADVASGPGALVNSPVTGWTGFHVVNNSDIGSEWVGGGDFPAVADGRQYLYVNLYSNPNASTGVYQDVGALQADTDYTLTVGIGNRLDRQELPGMISLVNGTDNTGGVLASTYGVPGTQGSWQDYTVNFITGASVNGNLTIMLAVDPAITGVGNGGSIQAAFDNVRLEAMPVVAPTFAVPHISQGNLIVTGNGGTPNAGYTWLTATNLTPPINWQTSSTGTLNGVGALSNSIPINATQSANFFRLRMP